MMRSLIFSALLFMTACGQPAPPSIEVTDAWARATAPGQSSGAVYATISNKGGTADRLLAASSDQAPMAMIHQNEIVNGVARMRMVGTLDLPARGGIELKPGGDHIMLDGLKAPLAAGGRFNLRLRFERSGEKMVPVQVVAAGDR